MVRFESQLDILQKLNGVEREIAEAGQQALYRNRLVNTCFLQNYCNREFSLIFNLEATLVNDSVFPIHTRGRDRMASVQFAIRVSYGNSSDVTDGVQAEKQEMLIGDVEIVKCPNGAIMPSVVWLNLGHNAIPKRWTPGIYLNPVKGTLDFVPFLPNRELSIVGELSGRSLVMVLTHAKSRALRRL